MNRVVDGCGAVGVADRQKVAGKTGAAHLRWLVVDRRWSESNWSVWEASVTGSVTSNSLWGVATVPERCLFLLEPSF